MTARDAWGQVAHELHALAAAIEAAIDQPERERAPRPAPASQAAAAPSPAAAPLPPRKPQESAFTECPAHRQPFKEGKFGLYCSGQSDDPDWSNDKGYCRVTPRSAAAWLRQHPQGAPAPAPRPQMDDEEGLPF